VRIKAVETSLQITFTETDAQALGARDDIRCALQASRTAQVFGRLWLGRRSRTHCSISNGSIPPAPASFLRLQPDGHSRDQLSRVWL
jgi:hypothetical protein